MTFNIYKPWPTSETEEYEQDVINIKSFSIVNHHMTNKTKKALTDYAQSMRPSNKRAQCLTIASYTFDPNETIADRFLRDHSSPSHAARAALILVECGRANHTNIKRGYFGTITFEDNSKL